jgi:hypothetical protein
MMSFSVSRGVRAIDDAHVSILGPAAPSPSMSTPFAIAIAHAVASALR